MTTIAIGPGLANFPAFPDPTSVDPSSLGFVITADRFAFSINGYQFEFSGDFSAIPEPRVPNFFATLSPAFPINELPFITLTGNTVTQIATGQTAIGFSGAATTLPANFFFATLLDPRNFTDDIITAFFGDITRFNTLDLSAFDNGVYIGAPNASVISPEGAIGVVSFSSELDGFTFTDIIGGSGDDRLFGNSLNNTIVGNSGSDFVLGLAGNDILLGYQGDDVLVVGRGRDELQGGDGHDVLEGGRGRNQLSGGGGGDRFVLIEGTSTITDFDRHEGDKIDVSALGIRSQRQLAHHLASGLKLNRAGELVLSLSSNSQGGSGPSKFIFQNLNSLDSLQLSDFIIRNTPNRDRTRFGSNDADRLAGTNGDDLLIGKRGADWLLGKRGDDVLYGDTGKDVLRGSAGDDLLYGGAGADKLSGGVGNDVLDGGAGRDLLDGGKGSNTLTGGTGADTFRFTRLTGQLDRITDFDIGIDSIDIDALVRVPITVQNFEQYIQITSPGPTELTRFVGIDRNGSRGGANFTPLFQIDDVTDSQILAAITDTYG